VYAWRGLLRFNVGNEVAKGKVDFVDVPMSEVCYKNQNLKAAAVDSVLDRMFPWLEPDGVDGEYDADLMEDVDCGGGFRIIAFECADYCAANNYCGMCVSESLKQCHWAGVEASEFIPLGTAGVKANCVPSGESDIGAIAAAKSSPFYAGPEQCCKICEDQTDPDACALKGGDGCGWCFSASRCMTGRNGNFGSHCATIGSAAMPQDFGASTTWWTGSESTKEADKASCPQSGSVWKKNKPEGQILWKGRPSPPPPAISPSPPPSPNPPPPPYPNPP
jgi:hypothetical protein